MSANPLALIRIIDDDPDMRASLEFLLSTEGWRVTSYASAQEFLSKDDPLIPGCMLLDVRMPAMSGLELQERLKNAPYSIPILFISAHGDIDMAVHTLKCGALDFLTKPIDDERLLESVENAVACDWEFRAQQMNDQSERKRFETLTAREKAVVRLVAKGLMNKVIADKLGVGEKTVQVHRGNACRKLKVRSAVEIARILDHLNEN